MPHGLLNLNKPAGMTSRRVVDVVEGTNLGQFLKFSRAVVTGGEAKMLIEGGQVRVNGQPERRRGHALREGDLVEAGGQALVVHVVPRREGT